MRIALWLLFVHAAGCGGQLAEGADDSAGGGLDAGGTSGTCLSSSECPTGFICNEFGRCEMPAPPPTGDGGTEPPPETEIEIGPPVSSQSFVYVAMTSQDELARIDGHSLAVTSIAVGHEPRVVSTIPGSDGAMVLDAGNGTATIVHPQGTGDTVKVVPTLRHLNRLDVDPTGRFAVIWFDLVKAIDDGGIGGIGSFQDVTVVALAPGAEHAVDLTVGFRPRAVQFDTAGSRAYVITQDGVSVIDLAAATSQGPTIVPPIPVADPTVPPEDLEVQIVANGELAVVRQANVAKLRLVNVGATQPGLAREVPLASPASDLDLAPDGSRAYAVARDAKQLAIVALPAATVTTIDLSDATLGSLVLSRDGKRALLFTNATLDERVTLVKLDQAGFPHQTFPLKKAVRAIGIAPTTDSAIVIHAKAPGDPAGAGSVDEFIDRSFGYSLLDLASGFAKLEVTPVDPGSFAYAPDGSKAYVALDGGDDATATRALQIVTARTGVVTTKALGSPPDSLGILPVAGTAFAAQRHPLGRVSFVGFTDDAMRTVTGFDLNGHVVN